MKTKFISLSLLIGLFVSINVFSQSAEQIDLLGSTSRTGLKSGGSSVDNFVEATVSGKILTLNFLNTACNLHVTIQDEDGTVIYSNVLNVVTNTRLTIDMSSWPIDRPYWILIHDHAYIQIEGEFYLE